MSWSKFSGKVERCEDEGGWFTVAIPQSFIPPKELITGHFGYIPVTAKIASSKWDTSLLPLGDGTYFIALPKKIRSKQSIDTGDVVSIEFQLRNHHNLNR